MADLTVTPVATQIKPVPGMSLSDVVGMARGIQELKQQTQLMPLQAESARQTVAQQKIATQKAEMGISEDRMRKIADSQVSMINNPLVLQAERSPDTVDKQKLKELVLKNGMETAKAIGIEPNQAMSLLAPYLERVDADPASLRIYYKQRLSQGLDDAVKAELFQPRGVSVQTGAGGYQVQTGEFGPYAVGQIIPGTQFQQAIGPGERVQPTGRVDAQGNPTAYVYGPDGRLLGEQVIPAGVGGPTIGPGSMPPNLAAPVPGGAGAGVPPPPVPPSGGMQKLPLPAGQPAMPEKMPLPAGAAGAPMRMSAGETGMLEANIDQAQKDWQQTTFDNQGAQSRIATFQKIKSLVPEAYTGVGSDKKKFVSGLAQMVGLPVGVLETAATEELAKNSAILQLAGGNTDAARGIAELANPNTRMTKEGINRVTEQLISFERMKQKKAEFLQPFSRDAGQYMKVKEEFDRTADPRMFQESTPEDVAKMKASMSDSERKEFAEKVKRARQLGIL